MKIENIFSYVKEKRNKIYYTLPVNDIEETDIFQDFSITNATKFNKTFKSNDDECFYLELLSDEDKKIIEPFLAIFESGEISNELKKKNYGFEDIDNIFYKVNCNIKIQKLYCKYYFKKKTFLIKGGLRINEDMIVFQKEIDAIFDINTNKLYFKNFKKIKSIFPGIEKFYREATDKDCKEFLDCSKLNLINFDNNSITNSIRQKIAIMLDEKQLEKNDIINKIEDCIKICTQKNNKFVGPKIENNKIIIKDKKDIEKLYKILNGCYYTNMIDDELMETNSQKKYNGD